MLYSACTLYTAHMLYSAFSNGTIEFVLIASSYPCKYHSSMLCIALVPYKAVYNSILHSFIVDKPLQNFLWQ